MNNKQSRPIVRIVNKTKSSVLAEKAEIANTPLSRMKGLLGRDKIDLGEGLVIVPCSAIHTFFMKFSIDVAFIDVNNKVVALSRDLTPGKLFSGGRESKKVIELPVGILESTNTCIQDLIELQ
ncbi:DUF192 domain-containing protein [Thermoproteota archaeon]